MNIHVIYRLCDKVDSVNGLKRPFGFTKSQVIQSCFKSLVQGLGENPWAMTILADDVSQKTQDFIGKTLPNHFDFVDISKEETLPAILRPELQLDVPYNNNYVRFLQSTPPLKNLGSILKAYEVADTIQDDETWIYFLEDDYLHDPRTFYHRFNDFVQFASQYRFALPIFIHPSDYPDQYSRLLSRCYLFQTNTGYWREVSSTTGTFLCQAKTYRRFSKFFKECGTDDGKISSIFKKQAYCFSPLPGFASHMHEGVMSGYINWTAIIKELNG